jgi:hypothetical protein
MSRLNITQTLQNLKPDRSGNLICSLNLNQQQGSQNEIHHFYNPLVGFSIPKCIHKFIPGIFLTPEQHWYEPLTAV